MSDTPLHSVSVAGVTFDSLGRVLLISRRDDGRWQAPGGVLELHETFEEGVVREVLEETGVQVRCEQLTGVYKNVVKHVVALVYRCEFVSGFPHATSEAKQVQWVPLEVARERMTEAFFVRIDDAAIRASSIPASRSHDGTVLY